MSRSPNRRRSGHTLTEMMMVVAITGILATVGPPLFIGLQNFFLMTTARFEIQRDARTCLDTVNRFLRQAVATSVQIDTAGGGPYSRITFRMVDGRHVQFYQDGTTLMQRMTSVGGQVSLTPITKNLIYIAFTYPRTDDPTILSVSITMGKAIQLGQRKVLELTIQKVRVMN